VKPQGASPGQTQGILTEKFWGVRIPTRGHNVPVPCVSRGSEPLFLCDLMSEFPLGQRDYVIIPRVSKNVLS